MSIVLVEKKICIPFFEKLHDKMYKVRAENTKILYEKKCKNLNNYI